MNIENLALTFVPGLGVRGIVHLLEMYGAAAEVFARSESELVGDAELRGDIARRIVAHEGWRAAEHEAEYCRRNGVMAIASTDEGYPPLLRTASDYPHILYMVGDPDVFRSPHILSIVGTRAMTSYGERVCNEIVEAIASKFPDAVIVSGLAFGTDVAAHRAAMAFHLRTVGVVPCGLPSVVPTQHSGVARDMVKLGGAVVSEVSSQTRQNGNMYIPRNRIVAGIGEGLLVIESAIAGGSISTVRAADSYGREVMAVPGRVTDKMSQGTNSLIASQVAHAVCSADDVIRLLGWQSEATAPTKIKAEVRPLNENEKLILGAFSENTPLAYDEIVARTGLSPAVLSGLLLDMELSGDLRCLPGMYYEKL